MQKKKQIPVVLNKYFHRPSRTPGERFLVPFNYINFHHYPRNLPNNNNNHRKFYMHTIFIFLLAPRRTIIIIVFNLISLYK